MDVTVIIPTLNGERYLERLLGMIERQDFDGEIEVLVVDSGSTDRTLEIVRARPQVRLHEIPNSEFGHGRTRNLAARLANGTYLAFLTQDAIPVTTSWLRELVGPLEPDGSGAVAVLGKQVPRANCFPLLKYEIQRVFARFGPDAAVTLFQRGETAPTGAELELLSFYSDVNSATRRDFLLDVIPYRDLQYSEDMAFGRDLIEAGYRKAYAPMGSVEHSNDLSLGEYRKRIFDETISIRRGGHSVAFTRWQQLLRGAYGVLRDSVRIIRDPDYGVGRTIFWLVANPFYHLAKWQAYDRAMSTAFDDRAANDVHSLEAHRVRSAKKN